jgi:uncharacterized delta-60 repeat protein
VVAAPPGAGAAHRGPTLDPSFGGAGLVTSDHGGGDEVVDLALQPDGRIVAVGGGMNAQTGHGGFNLVRHLPNGVLDESFGQSGVVATNVDPAGTGAYPAAMALRPDGRILVAGRAGRASGQGAPVLVSYLPDGTLDGSFGTDGRLYPDLGPNVSGGFTDMVLYPDGAVLLAIEGAGTEGGDPIVLARLRPDGEPDPSFGDGGLVRADLGPREFDFVRHLAVAPDGSILVAGATGWWSTLPEPTTDVLLVRFTPAGAIDTSFGDDGRVIWDRTGPQGLDLIAGLAVAADGRVVLTVGYHEADGRVGAGLLRYLPDGRPDPGFGRRGFAPARLPGAYPWIGAPTFRPGGRILTTGYTNDSGAMDLVLAQYRPDGRPDPAFGHRGLVLTDIDGGSERGNALQIQPDGRLVVGGTADTQGGTSFAVFRYLP